MRRPQKNGTPKWCPVYHERVCWPLVLGFVDHLACGNPGHHGAQFFAGFFDLVRVVHATCPFEERLADLVFAHEVAHEFAGLDVGQNVFHPGFGFVVRQHAGPETYSPYSAVFEIE